MNTYKDGLALAILLLALSLLLALFTFYIRDISRFTAGVIDNVL